MTPQDFAPDLYNSKSARRTLYSASIITFIVANLTFISTKFGLFKLEVHFEQERLVAVGQISVFILLIVFLLRALPDVTDLLGEHQLIKLNREHSSETERWLRDWEQPEQYQDGPEGELKDLEAGQNHQSKSLRANVRRRTQMFKLIAEIIINYVLPIILGLLAIFQPYGLRLLTNFVICNGI